MSSENDALKKIEVEGARRRILEVIAWREPIEQRGLSQEMAARYGYVADLKVLLRALGEIEERCSELEREFAYGSKTSTHTTYTLGKEVR